MTSTELITTQDNDLWGEAAQRWLEAVERRRGSTRSRQEYEKSIANFFAYLEGKHPVAVAGADCQRWVAAMQEAGLSKNTINARLVAVNSFYQFVCTRFEVEPGRYLHHFNPATVVQRLHINPYEKAQGLSPEQVRALLKTCDRKTILGARDFALLTFYLYTGRRRSEIARLTWADIRGGSKPNQKEYYYKGKGSKGGWRELPAPVWSAVKSYLKQAGRLTEMEPESPLFVATNDHASRLGKTSDGPIGERTISQVVNRAAKLAGLEHIKVHALRHTAAKLRRRSGASLEEVSQFLDHSSIATTQIYLGAVEAKEDIGWKKIEALIGLEGEVEEEV